MKNWLLVVVLLLFSTGCGSDNGISVGALNTILGNSTQIGDTVANQTASASVAKEALVHASWKEYYEAQEKIHEQSGTKIQFEMITLKDGTGIQVIKQLQTRDYAALPTPPEKPSEHPVWNTMSELGGIIAKYGLIGFGIYELAGAWEASIAGAEGTVYNGPMINSQNRVSDNLDMNSGEFIFGKQVNESFNPVTAQ